MHKGPIDHLSELITPKTAGIIWLTDSPLNSTLTGVYEFNYLTNGLLTKSIQNTENQDKRSNYFLTESFGFPLFLSHQVIDKVEDLKSVYNQLDISKSLVSEDRKLIYLLNKSLNSKNINVLKELIKRYAHLKFEHLNL
jgi:hypothetical protein